MKNDEKREDAERRGESILYIYRERERKKKERERKKGERIKNTHNIEIYTHTQRADTVVRV